MPSLDKILPKLICRTVHVDAFGVSQDAPPFLEWRHCYGRIRRWLQENKCRCELVEDKIIVHLQDGRKTRPLENGKLILKTIDSLPPESNVTPSYALQVFHMVRADMLEWSHWQYDGQFCMRDYALEGIKHFGSDQQHEISET